MNDHSTWGANHSMLLNDKEGAGTAAFEAVDALANGSVGTIAFSAIDAMTKAHTHDKTARRQSCIQEQNLVPA